MKKLLFFIIILLVVISEGCKKDTNTSTSQPDENTSIPSTSFRLAATPGILQWQKCYGSSANDNGYSITTAFDKSGYIISGNTSGNDGNVSGNHGGTDAWVAKVDLNGTISWQTTLGGTDNEEVHGVIATMDNGYLIAAYTLSSGITGYKGGGDIWLIKLSNSGSIEWQKIIGGSSFDKAWSLINTSDGGYALTGQTTSNDGDISGNHGSGDVWVIKLDNTGNITWQKSLGGTSDEVGYSIVQSADGGYAIAGRTLSNDGDIVGYNGNGDVWVVKLNSNGDKSWTKCIGGTAMDVGFGIATTQDNGYVITGRISGGDLLAVKLNETGNIIWQKTFGGTQTELGKSIIAVKNPITNTEEYIIVGNTNSTNGDVTNPKGGQDFWVLRLNTDGSKMNANSLGGKGTEGGEQVIVTPDGMYIAVGSTSSNTGDVTGNHGLSDLWVVKFKY